MTEAQFRSIALDLPETDEGEHMGHADFRVKGKIFASLGSPKPGFGMVKLTPQQQARWMKTAPQVFTPATGAWGAKGATHIALKEIDRVTLRAALLAAWRNTAPPKMVEALGPEK